MQNNKYNLVAENPQSTVVAEYIPNGKRVSSYQSEAELEKSFYKTLRNSSLRIFNYYK